MFTGLFFFQNAAEQSVIGWMVTYFKGSGIIAGTLAAYTVTVMWGATLVGRLLIAFVCPLKNPRKAMVGMSVLCTFFYVLLVMAHTQGMAIVLLFAFAFAMAGMNPTAVASAGNMTTVTSMGIMLPAASSGAILMPWIIGRVARGRGACRRYGIQHRALRGPCGLYPAGGKAAGGMMCRLPITLSGSGKSADFPEPRNYK